MFSNKRWAVLVALVLVVVAVLAACQAEPEVVEREVTRVVTETVEVEGEPQEVTRVVTEVVEATPEAEEEEMEEEEAAEGELAEVYRIGIFEDPVSGFNYWNYLGPGSSVWTQYVQVGNAASLFTLSDKRYDFVPSLATEMPEPTQLEDGNWEIVVNMVDGATWSDGEPVTADDVVFTHNTCKDLELTSNWPNACAPGGADVTAEATDEYTVRYTFNTTPSLGVWTYGVAQAPILPEHFWASTVEEARSFIADIGEEPEHPEGVEDCQAEELSAEDEETCAPYLEELNAYNEAFTNARTTLYEADGQGSPAFGGYVNDQFEPGAFFQRTMNANYFFQGSTIREYDDGTWILENPNGIDYQLYGDAEGEETLNFVAGPYSENILLSIYGSQDAAFLALANGEVDYVINPLGLSRGLREQAERGEGVVSYENADNGLFYVAFNMRQSPGNDAAFREAVDCLIDKEFVVNSVLQGSVFPMYSVVPPGNEFWHNPDVPQTCVGLSRQERISRTIEVLTGAGWSWDVEPRWSDDLQDVEPGQGLTMPNGEPMPEITILGPGPAYDPIRATFNQWISEWMRDAGMPVESELTGFNTILGPVFQEANFDMYILGWSLTIFPDYLESFWHSRNDTAVSGNFNTPGYSNAEYDAMADEFLATTSLERAQELAYQMQVKLAEDRPYIPLFYQQVTDLARDNIQFPYTETLGGIVNWQGMQTDAQVLAE
ncbi:MAG: ABC transporter substrate-binding protein [Candidatus Promineifilaceae bacterium]|nr:ABC transporter substrate-binding protein [Candidatus Promineifilaceae bacterium]